MVGKKGVAFFRFLGREIEPKRSPTIGDAPRFDEVEPLANG